MTATSHHAIPDSVFRKVLMAVLLAILFIWLPGGALVFTIHHLQTEYDSDRRSHAERQLESFLERAADEDDAVRFWSRVCQRIDQQAMLATDSLSQLSFEFARLQRWIPDASFRLIVWNRKGSIIREDPVTTMNTADWQTIASDLNLIQAPVRERNTYEAVQRLQGSWQRLFGGGLVAQRVLNYTRNRRLLINPIGLKESARIWPGISREGAYILYLDAAAFRGPVGLRHACQFPPRWRYRGLAVGFLDPQEPDTIFASMPEFRQALAAIGGIRGFHQQATHAIGWFVAYRSLPSGRILTAGIRQPFLTVHGPIILGLFSLLLGLVSVRGTARLIRVATATSGHGFSVQAKLAVFFLLANGLPLLLLLMMSATQLRNREVSLLSNLHSSCAEMIRHFDEGVRAWNERTRLDVLRNLQKLEHTLATRPFSATEYKQLYRDMARLGCQNFMLCASSTADWITSNGYYPERGRSLRTGRAFDAKRERFFLEGIQRIIALVNGLPTKPVDRFELTIEGMFGISAGEFANNLLSGISRLTIWGDGSNRLPMVVKLFRSPDGATVHYLFLATFHPNFIGFRYFQSQLHTLNRNHLGLRFLVRSLDPSVINSISHPDRARQPVSRALTWVQFPREIHLPRALVNHVQSLSPLVTVSPEPFLIKNRPYLVIGGAGRELPEFVYFALYPYDNLQKQHREMRRNLLGFGILSLLFSAILAHALGRRFLEPIAVLQEGTRAIRRHAFTCRLPDLGNDEFGRIGKAVNNAMQSLEELAVARAVQENLLPEGVFVTGSCRGFGRTIPMSELGGDFFDFQRTGEFTSVLSIGDVTGHGVPAALVMAMAKSVLYRLHQDGISSECIYSQLNELLLQMHRRKTRRALSLQSVEIDDRSEVLRITSAGHCYPAHLTPAGVSLIRFSSTPVGVTQRHRFATQEVVFR
ncbi:MAG TPA: SpoIIE family protein phosphatase, partial [Candidatus Ozemobacteraceae bacterium]|nr:SpoIIE family protein phosphatase [Candidatus Ozemobacteraceae bacterium]